MILLKNVWLNSKQQDILIQGDTFLRIGDKIDLPELSTQVIDCTNKAILPSFCNMHTHASMMFLRGVGEDKPLFEWLQQDIWPREAKLTPEMIYHLSRFAILEMIKSGTTLFSDMYFFVKETIKATQEMGIRGAISYLCMDFFDKKKIQTQQEELIDFLDESSPSSRILKGISCHSIYTTSQELFLKSADLAKRHKTFLHIHAAETQKEVNDCLEQHSCTPIELMNKWNVLDKNTLLAHCVHLTENDIRLLAQHNVAIAHCPTSNLKLNSGVMPFQRCLDAGIHITIGTDGVSSNNSLSMIQEMKMVALSGKHQANNTSAARIDDVFASATQNGFDFFGIKAGKIAENYLADFILVDMDNVFLLPCNDLKSNIIYASDTSCITDVFCDGKQVMKNGQVKDEENIIREFKKVYKHLL